MTWDDTLAVVIGLCALVVAGCLIMLTWTLSWLYFKIAVTAFVVMLLALLIV